MPHMTSMTQFPNQTSLESSIIAARVAIWQRQVHMGSVLMAARVTIISQISLGSALRTARVAILETQAACGKCT